RRHTRCLSDWSSDVCSSDLNHAGFVIANIKRAIRTNCKADWAASGVVVAEEPAGGKVLGGAGDLATGIERDEDDFVAGGNAAVRSEERRVGKEWRCGVAREH